MLCAIRYHLYNFKKREKHPWRSVTFSKIAGFKPSTLLNVTLLHGCFRVFKTVQMVEKLRKTSHAPCFPEKERVITCGALRNLVLNA